MPLAIAILLFFVFSPLVEMLERLRIPRFFLHPPGNSDFLRYLLSNRAFYVHIHKIVCSTTAQVPGTNDNPDNGDFKNSF